MKKIFLKIIIILITLLLISFLMFFYHITDGYRDHKEFCSKYIPLLEQYHHKYKVYPSTLTTFPKSFWDFRYSFNECNYRITDDYYTFTSINGLMGVIGYSSKDAKWWHD